MPKYQLEALAPHNEDEALAFIERRFAVLGIDHRDSVNWRRRDAITFGRGWLLRDLESGNVEGIITLPVYELAPGGVKNGVAYFDVADIEALPPKIGLHCLVQPAIIVEAALSAAQFAAPQQLVTHCPPGWGAREALLSLGAIFQDAEPDILYLWPRSVALAAKELKKHLGVVSTKTCGRNGEAEVKIQRAGRLFSIGHLATISRIAGGDLSAIGHDLVVKQADLGKRRSGNIGFCAA